MIIESFKAFKEDYKYDILRTYALAKKVQKFSLSEAIRERAKKIEKNILNSNRKSDIQEEIYFSYVLYLMNFLSIDSMYNMSIIFERLYHVIKNTSDFQKKMDSITLKYLVNEVKNN